MRRGFVGVHAGVVGYGARPAVNLPGVGRYGDDGRGLAEAIGSSHTTHLLDIPGTGRSATVAGVSTLEAFCTMLDDYLDDARLGQVDLIGHSLGGILSYARPPGSVIDDENDAAEDFVAAAGSGAA